MRKHTDPLQQVVLKLAETVIHYLISLCVYFVFLLLLYLQQSPWLCEDDCARGSISFS